MTFDLIAPEGQSPGTDVQYYVWSQASQHHRFVVLGGRQLGPHDVQLSRQSWRTGRADGRRTAELTRPMFVTENMWARCDPGKAAQLRPTLGDVAQECVVTERHGHDCGKYTYLSLVETSKLNRTLT